MTFIDNWPRSIGLVTGVGLMSAGAAFGGIRLSPLCWVLWGIMAVWAVIADRREQA